MTILQNMRLDMKSAVLYRGLAPSELERSITRWHGRISEDWNRVDVNGQTSARGKPKNPSGTAAITWRWIFVYKHKTPKHNRKQHVVCLVYTADIDGASLQSQRLSMFVCFVGSLFFVMVIFKHVLCFCILMMICHPDTPRCTSLE